MPGFIWGFDGADASRIEIHESHDEDCVDGDDIVEEVLADPSKSSDIRSVKLVFGDRLYFSGESDHVFDWAPILKWLSTNRSIQFVVLSDSGEYQLRKNDVFQSIPALPEVLKWIAQTQHIKTLKLEHILLPDLAIIGSSLLNDNSNSIEELIFLNCYFSSFGDIGKVELQAQISSLSICCCREEAQVALLREFSQSTIKCLKLDVSDHVDFNYMMSNNPGPTVISLNTVLALKPYLETLIRLELEDAAWDNTLFEEISAAMKTSPTLTSVDMVACKFDEGASKALASTLTSMRHLHTLALQRCGIFHSSLLEDLLKADSPLRALTFDVTAETDNTGEDEDEEDEDAEDEERQCQPWKGSSKDFDLLMSSVASSSLESLAVGIHSRRLLPILLNAVPNLQVKCLNISSQLLHYEEIWRNEFVDRVQKNAYVLDIPNIHCYTELNGECSFNASLRKRLNGYLARNNGLAEWMKSPTMLQPRLWPLALKALSSAGPDTLFRVLRNLELNIQSSEGSESESKLEHTHRYPTRGRRAKRSISEIV